MTTPTKTSQTALPQTAWARIDLAALKHNAQIARQSAPASKLWAVIKADAYGHGALPVAAAISAQADGLIVARVSEGLALRAAGHKEPILVLGGFHDGQELEQAYEQQLQLLIHSPVQLQQLQQSGLKLRCWLKVDSGMHRVGFAPPEVAAAHRQLQQISGQEVGLLSHFACADDPADNATAAQLACFNAATAGLIGPRSLANSAAILAHPASHADWNRPGIMLYGGAPLVGQAASTHALKPVMTLASRVVAVRPLAAGEAVGYAASWRSSKATRIAVIAIGYGDGYPRHAPSGTPVLINGQRYPLAGRVSMDLITVAIGDAAISEGDEAILWGEGLAASEIANCANTIDYALFCGVTARVARHYRQGC